MPDAPIYLDHNASAPLDPEVREAMLPFLGEVHGNSRSSHAYGVRVREAVEQARAEVAGLLGCTPEEVVFTGGGSEAVNLAIKGLAWANPGRRHLVHGSVEHYAVSGAVAFLERQGWARTVVGVDGQARVRPAELEAALRADTLLLCLQHANNEVGTVQEVPALAGLAHARGALVLVDAAQSAGKLPVEVGPLGADLLALAGHKFCGPQGIGALYVRRGVALEPLVHGAGHEGGLRSGTLPVAQIVGLGRACALARARQAGDAARMRALRDRLHARLRDEVPGLVLNGHPEARLPHTLNVSFPGHWGGAVLAAAPGVAGSTGASCHAGVTEPSLTLAAMGAPREVGIGAVRLSLGRSTTEAEVDEAARLLGAAWRSLARPA